MTIASSSRVTLDAARPRPPPKAHPQLESSRRYAWADRPENAVLASCRDVARMPLASQQGGLDVYLHRSRPCKHAIIVGRVVGVTEKEAAAIYLVDDGTSVLELLYRGHVDKKLMATAHVTTRKDRRLAMPGEAGPLHSFDYPGIPPQYLPPRPKPRPPPKKNASSAARWPPPSPLLPGCDVGVLVRVAGRIVLDWDAKRRLVVDAGGGDASKVEGSIAILDDPNEELTHVLERIRLARDVYSQPFELPPEPAPTVPSRRSVSVTDWSGDATPKAHNPHHLPAATLRALRELRGDQMEVDPTASGSGYSFYTTHPKRASTSPEPKPTRKPKVRRFLPIDDVQPGSRAVKQTPKRPTAPPVAPSRSSRQPTASRQQLLSSPSSVASRKLRHHSKLADERISDDLFRLHVQRWVVEHCGVPLEDDGADPDSHGGMPPPPPLFTLAYLLRVPDLTSLGRRLIGLKLQRRERKQAAERGKGTSSAASSEPLPVKLERLFAWAVRQMVHDGLVALGPCDAVAQPPFDGRRPEPAAPMDDDDDDDEAPPSSGSYSGTYQRLRSSRPAPSRRAKDKSSVALREAELLEWSDDGTDDSETESELDSLQGTPTQARPQGRLDVSAAVTLLRAKAKSNAPVTESYQLVHPSSLASDLHAILTSLPASEVHRLDAATALERLRRRDERWRFVAESAVREGLEWVR